MLKTPYKYFDYTSLVHRDADEHWNLIKGKVWNLKCSEERMFSYLNDKMPLMAASEKNEANFQIVMALIELLLLLKVKL